MITTSQLGNRGNLGNQMFQIAAVIGIAEANGHDCFFPEWQYETFFEKPLPKGEINDGFELIREKQFHFYNWELQKGNYDLKGWLQSEKYFNREKTKETFTFKKEIVSHVLHEYNYLFDKKCIIISVRRGDFVNNPYYFQLSYRYYLSALIENFPDWNSYNIIFTSDDISYCEYHFSTLNNVFFLKEVPPMEQLILAQQCDHFIISNSTFSWWMAWLGEKENSRVIRPIKNFRGTFALSNDDKDFFPERWTVFNDKNYKLPNRYNRLKLRAFIYALKVNAKFRYKANLFLLKKKVKVLIGRK